jgi:serine/threonine protein kinase
MAAATEPPAAPEAAAPSAFDELFEIKDILGAGAFCVVYRCQELATGQEFAVKIIDLTQVLGQFDEAEWIGRMKREINILSKLNHPSIVKLHKVFSVPRSKLYIVLELCTGGELCDLVMRFDGHLTEDTTRVIMIQIVEAVAYLHSHGIAHRDLKMENILLAQPYDPDRDPIIKLVDFGFARDLPLSSACADAPNDASVADTTTGDGIPSRSGNASPMAMLKRDPMNLSFVGTLGYAAPEVIAHKSYDCRCDLYSVGVLMYFCLAGSLPFSVETFQNGSTTLDLKEALSFTDPIWNSISAEAKDLVQHLLVDEEDRFTAGQFLSHLWCLRRHDRHVPDRPPRRNMHRHKASLKAPVDHLIEFKRGEDGVLVEQVGSKLRRRSRKHSSQNPRIIVTQDSDSEGSSDTDSSSSSSLISSPSVSPSISPDRSSLTAPKDENLQFLAVPGMRIPSAHRSGSPHSTEPLDLEMAKSI